jgi:hypothetical protein
LGPGKLEEITVIAPMFDERPVREQLDGGDETDVSTSVSVASPGAASTPSVAYDYVDMRLMDTFPASDAVARF